MLQIVEYLLQWYDRKSRLWGCNNVYKIGHKVERTEWKTRVYSDMDLVPTLKLDIGLFNLP